MEKNTETEVDTALFKNSIVNIYLLFAKQREKTFLWKIITYHKKWIMYDNPKRTHS